MTIDLENILDRICPLRTLELAFHSTKISKFFWGSMLPDPLSGLPLQRSPDLSVIKKKTLFIRSP